jgi:hypothetical protein
MNRPHVTDSPGGILARGVRTGKAGNENLKKPEIEIISLAHWREE